MISSKQHIKEGITHKGNESYKIVHKFIYYLDVHLVTMFYPFLWNGV